MQVINLVCANSIEHRILHVLEHKRTLAVRVLDGVGETEMALPSGRRALVERLNDLMGIRTEAPAPKSAPKPAGDGTGPSPLGLGDLPRELEARQPGGLERLATFDAGVLWSVSASGSTMGAGSGIGPGIRPG